VKGSAAILARRLSRDGVGTCASGQSTEPPGVSIHFVHWWSGSYVVEVGGGMAGCGIMHGGRVGVVACTYVQHGGSTATLVLNLVSLTLVLTLGLVSLTLVLI
jgi:hypothetical protein